VPRRINIHNECRAAAAERMDSGALALMEKLSHLSPHTLFGAVSLNASCQMLLVPNVILYFPAALDLPYTQRMYIEL